MDEDNVQRQLEELLKQSGNNFSILEEQINLDLQMTFFKALKDYASAEIEMEVSEAVLKLKEAQTEEEQKNAILALCVFDEPEAFRALEANIDSVQGDLYDWNVLALQQCRMGLENKLLGEYQVFISTGLGGKGNKLRYFVALRNVSEQTFPAWQQGVVESEFEIILRENEGELERMILHEQYITMLVLLPLPVSVKEVVDAGIDKCNELGRFLSRHFLITNVKQLTWEEVERSFQKKEDSDILPNKQE